MERCSDILCAVDIFKSRVGPGEVNIACAAFVLLIIFAGENELVILAHNFVKSPVGNAVIVDDTARHCGVHYLGQLFLILEAECVHYDIGYLILL